MCKCTWTKVVFIGYLFAMAANATLQTPSLSLSTASGAPGSAVTLDVGLTSGTSTLPVSIQWDLTYSTSDLNPVTGTFYATGAAASGAEKSVSCSIISAGDVRCIVSGINTLAIGNGVLATLTFQIAAGTTDTSTPVSMISSEASDANANPLSITDGSAAVTINQPAAPVLSALSCSPASVTPPTSSTCTATLSSSAASTTTVGLSSSASAATVPASMNISSGSLSKNFTVSSSSVTTNTTALITATLGSSSEHFSLTLTAPTCAYSLSTNSSNLSSSAGAGSFNVITSAGCTWSVTNNSSFITVTGGGSGSGNGTVSYSIPANTGAARSGTLTIGGQTFTANQAAASSVGPAPVSVAPSSGTSTNQSFAFTFSDPAGVADINSAQIVINSSLTGVNSCKFYIYANGANVLYLANDAGAFQSSLPIGAAGTLQNSQCSVNVGASSVTSSGTTLTLHLALSFAPAFAGSKNIYMYVQNATVGSSWVQNGTWTVPSVSAPAPVSVTPSSGSGSSQNFTFAFSDPAGAADINSAQIVINSSTARTNGCYFYLYANGSNVLYLANNAGALQSGLAVGAAGTMQNSQCSVNVGGSSVTSSGTTLTLNLALSFTPAFTGPKNIYMYVQNATVGSSLTQEGTWTVPGVPTPTPVSVTPSSGSGSSQTFTFAFSDPAGATDISSAQIIIGSSTATTNSCYLDLYASGSNVLYLANNAGAFQSSLAVGATGTLQNSQCSVNVGASSVTLSGTTLTLNLALSFTPAFAGSKNIYMYVQNATLGSSLTQEGTWTVPGGSGPVPVSVTPSSGSGSPQNFSFTFSDPGGVADINSAQIVINSSLGTTNSCYFYLYASGSNVLYLANDAGAFQSSLAVGATGTLQNSQCSVNLGASSVTSSGTTFTLNLVLSFTPAFAGSKNIYMYVQNASVGSAWVQEGTWMAP